MRDSVYLDVDFLIVEADRASNRCTFCSRDPIVPYQVLVFFPVENNVIVFCVALIGTFCLEITLPEDGRIDGTKGEVIPSR